MIKIKTAGVILALFLFVGIASVSGQQNVKTPEQVAQSLVDAFNARDMDGILKAYASDSTAYSLPDGKVMLKGHDALRKKFGGALDPKMNMKVEVVNRIVDGKFVIDKEKITGTSNGKPIEFFGTVIYEITDGLIRNEWYPLNK
jgi:hypothetical protein